MSGMPRPPAPAPVLLDRARRGATDMLGVAGDRWIVAKRMDRSGSILFPLTLRRGDDDVLRAFYKVYTPLGEGDVRAARSREVAELLGRLPALTSEFNDLVAQRPLSMPPVLLADPAEHALVVVALDGQQIGRMLRWAPWTARSAEAVFELVGEGVATMERCRSVPHPAWPAPDIPKFVGGLRDALDDRQKARLAGRLQDLHAGASAARLVHCHGDLSTDNVFVTARGIGIIDAEWYARWPGYDIAKLSVRLEFELLARRPRVEALINALMRGYGDVELRCTPAWQFRRLWEIVRIARRAGRSPRGCMDRRRALEHLRDCI